MKRTWNWPILLGAALALTSCAESGPAPAATGEAVPPDTARRVLQLPQELLESGRVTVSALERGPVPRVVLVSGHVTASPDGVLALSASSDARVTAISVHVGQLVEKGTVLMRLDAPAVATARADLERGRALEQRAQLLVDQEQRLQSLLATNVRDSSLARQELALARAQQAEAQGNLRAWGAASGGGAGVTLKAPFAAIVSHVDAELGSTVTTGSQLVRLMQPGAVSVTAHVPERVARTIAARGARIRALGAEDQPCLAEVLGHSQRVDATVGTVPFVLAPERRCAVTLFEGAVVEVDLPLLPRTGDEQLVNTLASSITRVDGVTLLFVQTGPTTFEPAPVTELEVWGERAYFRWAGAPDARVVSSGAVLLKGELMRGDLE